MASALGPTLANAFLCDDEIKWLRECPVAYALIFYKRYVEWHFCSAKDWKPC